MEGFCVAFVHLCKPPQIGGSLLGTLRGSTTGRNEQLPSNRYKALHALQPPCGEAKPLQLHSLCSEGPPTTQLLPGQVITKIDLLLPNCLLHLARACLSSALLRSKCQRQHAALSVCAGCRAEQSRAEAKRLRWQFQAGDRIPLVDLPACVQKVHGR